MVGLIMPVTHYAILLDIDNTLIDFDASSKDKAIWIGSAGLWQEYIGVLKTSLNTGNTRVHIGIATSKLKYFKNGKHTHNGDVLSAAVIEDEKFLKGYGNAVGLGRNLGLKRFLNPDLIFFTDGLCKVVNALDHVKNIIQKQFKQHDIILDKTNIMLIDDQKETCDLVIASGYQCICVDGLVKLDQAKREAQIGSLFLKIFETFNLPIPVKMLKAVGVISDEGDDEEERGEVAEELINYMSSAVQTGINTLEQLRMAKKSKLETYPHKAVAEDVLKHELQLVHNKLRFFRQNVRREYTERPWAYPEHYMFRK
jgi:hypothetical protein